MKSKYEKDYLKADRFITVNDNDPDLLPIVLSLPKPPPLHLIDGYGLPPSEQRFKRDSIPRRLLNLEAEAIDITKEELASNKNNVVTLLKIQKTFWRLVRNRNKELKKDIDFIRQCWWKRINGSWFFNNGTPTYISGWHWYYLNFWTMNTADGTGRPEYRDRDRKEYIFALYCLTTTESFERLDKDGFAIKEDDGTYKMKDHGRRVCFGKMQPKNRRSGNTNKGLSNGLEMVSRTERNHGMGIQSFSNQNAKDTFDGLLMPAFEKIPIWFKPNTTSGRTSDSLVFNVGKNEYGEPALQTQCTYATTASEKFYDSKKLYYILTEEPGKTDEVDVAMRHEVNKQTVSLGDGRLIHGYMDYPSTVNETSEGAAYYRALSNTSNFYQRIKSSGQTKSGLFRLFVPATEGLEDFVDSYGQSVSYSVSDVQKEEGFVDTAIDVLQGKRDALRNDNSSESLRLLREARKLFPIKYADCWLGESGDIGLNLEIIDGRVAQLRRHDDTIRVNFFWKDKFGGEVYYRIDEENGRFRMSMKPPDSVSNKMTQIMHFSTFEQKNVPMWRPMYPKMFTLGADPFRFGNKQDEKIGKSLNKRSRLSDGGIAVLWNYDESVDGGKDMQNWTSYKFALSYRYRAANTDEYNEDVLKAAIYFGAMVYPETNVPTTYEYFIRHKFGGYLLYDADKYSGRLKEKAGCDSLERSKQELFSLWRDYIEYRGHVEEHSEILEELKTIRGIEQMRHFDLIAAGGMALMGAKSSYVDTLASMENREHDLGDFFDF